MGYGRAGLDVQVNVPSGQVLLVSLVRCARRSRYERLEACPRGREDGAIRLGSGLRALSPFDGGGEA
jgi:hypothetical protein